TTTFADIVRVVLTSRAGTAVEDVDLEAERNRVYALGSFASVSLSFDQHGTDTDLVVSVKENPRISEITFEGVTALAPDRLRQIVENENILAPGRVLNTTRAQEAIQTIQTVYEQQGFPFRPEVTLDPYAVEGEDGAEEVTVNYVVEENPDVDSVTV